MYYKGDPCVLEFYQRHRALAVVTAKLKSQGEEKKGLRANIIATVDKKLAKRPTPFAEPEAKENAGIAQLGGNTKKHHSADRDLAAMGLVMSPRKRPRQLDS
ncbi:hypothetical protein FB451DRAFT_1180197 [Mycena latifolia]|nr:hypothetical protein FB451DRAFT_1180197 [Mycena latifolia]